MPFCPKGPPGALDYPGLASSRKPTPDVSSPPSTKAEPEGGLSVHSFEQSVQRLSAIVDSLEAGEQPLEESLRLFEEGMALTRRSQVLLDAAEQRIEQLLEVDEAGHAVTRPLEEDS